MKNVKLRKLLAALLGFAAGVVSDPLALLIWPIFVAWFLYNEADDDI